VVSHGVSFHSSKCCSYNSMKLSTCMLGRQVNQLTHAAKICFPIAKVNLYDPIIAYKSIESQLTILKLIRQFVFPLIPIHWFSGNSKNKWKLLNTRHCMRIAMNSVFLWKNKKADYTVQCTLCDMTKLLHIEILLRWLGMYGEQSETSLVENQQTIFIEIVNCLSASAKEKE